MTKRLDAYTKAELIEIINALASAQVQAAPAKKATPKVAKKAVAKVAKPTTRTEAIAQWKAQKGITPEKEAEFKALTAAYNAEYERNFAQDWAMWANSPARASLSGAARKEANRKMAIQLRNTYRTRVGMPAERLESTT